jgi:peptidoglycan/LPS O-acetylase OafA/YrhL
MPEASGLHYRTLDHWRGFAALSVVGFHACYPWIEALPPSGGKWIARVAGQGWKGVHLFFVVSGYCIALLALREIRRGQKDGGFLVSRCLRIFPPYWAACAVAAALALASLRFNHGALFSSRTVHGALPESFSSFLSHAFLFDPVLNRQGNLLVSWTLSWEVSFYLFAAGLIWIGISLPPRVAVVLALLTAFAGAGGMGWRVWPVLGGWAEFCCGGCLLLAFDARQASRRTWPWLAVIGTLGAVGALCRGSESTLPLSALFAWILYVLRPYDEKLGNLRMGRWLGTLGVMSYSVYLIHAPIVSAARNLLSRLIPASSVWFLFPILAAALLALGGAWAFYRWVEAPLERWRKSLVWLHRPSSIRIAPPSA